MNPEHETIAITYLHSDEKPPAVHLLLCKLNMTVVVRMTIMADIKLIEESVTYDRS